MPQIEVVLEVPMRIAAGLASGQMERVGGVVRNAGSKQVVTWLLEGGKIADNSNLAGGALKTLLDAHSGGLYSVVAALADAAGTARSHYLIMQELNALTNLVKIVGGIGMLNLATTVISAGIILKRMNQIEQEIKNLNVAITKEFTEDRQVKMETAINSANLALTMQGDNHRQTRAHFALDKLFDARQHIWLEIDTLKGTSNSADNNELMQKNVEQAMHLDALYSRCLLQLENFALAKNFLESNVQDYRETSRNIVHRHLGAHRAAYFHPTVLESDLLRYIAIENWLRPDGNRLMEVLIGNRRDFWNNNVADGKSIKKPGKEHYIEALTQSELLIENLGRMEGLLAEIEGIERLGISHSEWEKQQEEALAKAEINLAEHDDYVILVDTDWLAEQSDSLAA